jgi:hypothetical protein
VQVVFPCRRCQGSGVQPDTQRRCVRCVNDVGVDHRELVSVTELKRLLRRASN